MIVKITSKRQVTFPARVLEAMGVKPGDQLELTESPDGFILRPQAYRLFATWRSAGQNRSGDLTVRYSEVPQSAL